MADGIPDPHIPPEVPVPAAAPVNRAALRELNLWSWNDLALILTFTALAYLAANFLVILSYFGIKSFAGQRPLAPDLPQNPILPLMIELLFYGLIFAFVYFLVTIYHHRPFWSSLNWRRPTTRQILNCLLGGLMMAICVQLAPTVLPDKEDFPLQQMFSSPLAAYAVGIFAILVAPFMEELIFRGVLFAIFERRASLTFAIATTTVLFAALHVPEYSGAWNHILLIFLVSGVFSLTRGLTGSLAPSVILHFAYNLSLMVGLFFQTQGFTILHPSVMAK